MGGNVLLLMDTRRTTSKLCVFRVTDSSRPNHHPDAEMATPHTRSTSQNMPHTHTLEYTNSRRGVPLITYQSPCFNLFSSLTLETPAPARPSPAYQSNILRYPLPLLSNDSSVSTSCTVHADSMWTIFMCVDKGLTCKVLHDHVTFIGFLRIRTYTEYLVKHGIRARQFQYFGEYAFSSVLARVTEEWRESTTIYSNF